MHIILPMGVAQRKPRAVRRREIAEAALRIIGLHGLTWLSTSTLADEVGVSTGALFRHFSSFEEIYDEVVAYAEERLDETFPDPGLQPRERLERLFRSRMALLRGEPGLGWLLRSPQAAFVLPEAAREAMTGIVRKSRDTIRQALVEGQAAGTIRDDIPPEVLLLPLTATVHAAVGSPSVHGRAERGTRPDSDTILAGLMRLIATPPAEGRVT